MPLSEREIYELAMIRSKTPSEHAFWYRKYMDAFYEDMRTMIANLPKETLDLFKPDSPPEPCHDAA